MSPKEGFSFSAVHRTNEVMHADKVVPSIGQKS